MTDFCTGCGQLKGIKEYDEQLWNLYYRIDDGRSTYEPLVFTPDWLQENVQDQEDIDAVDLAMHRDMLNRGLCPYCARPNLSAVDPSRILSEKDAHDMLKMWAEQAAERRAGA